MKNTDKLIEVLGWIASAPTDRWIGDEAHDGKSVRELAAEALPLARQLGEEVTDTHKEREHWIAKYNTASLNYAGVKDERDNLREENGRLKADLSDEYLSNTASRELIDDLQVRLSVAEDRIKADEQNCAMSHVDESIYDDLRKENERLKADAEGHTICEQNMDAEIDRLKSRLSLAEQESKWYREDRDNFQMKFSASETRLAENTREDGVERWRGEAELYMRLYNEQREENEHLEGVISRCDTEIDELTSEVVDLQSLLSAAERERDNALQRIGGWMARCERAEEVTEAAKDAEKVLRSAVEQKANVQNLVRERLSDAIRRYEERR